MTNAELLAKIKAEIVRRWKNYRNSVTPDQPKYRTHYFVGKGEVCEELLSFLDTLSEEPDKSLEEAAEEYIKEGRYLPEAFFVRPAFIAGAEWQKEQMMKEAVEGVVHHYGNVHWIVTDQGELAARLKQFRQDEKVRLVIVKE